jgi:hypothetical protein
VLNTHNNSSQTLATSLESCETEPKATRAESNLIADRLELIADKLPGYTAQAEEDILECRREAEATRLALESLAYRVLSNPDSN